MSPARKDALAALRVAVMFLKTARQGSEEWRTANRNVALAQVRAFDAGCLSAEINEVSEGF